jgi:glycosyltransferase involved in cell wall biosynthesis
MAEGVVSGTQMRVSGSGALAPKPETRRLRVLTLTPFYPSAEDESEGGFVAEPLKWMAREEVENQVIAVRPFYRGRALTVKTEIASAWETYFSLPGNFGLASAGAFLATRLTPVLRETGGIDLIHSHGALACGHAARVIGEKLGIPFVVTVHGLDVFYEAQVGLAMRGWCRRGAEHVYRSAQRVICISEGVRERLGDECAENAEVIHNGVDTEMFSPGAELNAPTVLSVGNLIPIKGHALLLRAFARVGEMVPECSLEIFGDGPERGNLIRMAEELGIGGRVIFRGRQNRERIAEAMQRCAVFALPSSFEGLGCVYLEAMASGKAAIGCRGQGIEEIIEHGKNGLLVTPGNEVELSEALRVLLQNEEFRRRLGVSARATILQGHTLGHQARRLTEVYGECAW